MDTYVKKKDILQNYENGGIFVDNEEAIAFPDPEGNCVVNLQLGQLFGYYKDRMRAHVRLKQIIV